MTDMVCDCGHSAWMHVWGSAMKDKAFIAQCCEFACCCQHFNVHDLREELALRQEQAVASGRAPKVARQVAGSSRRRKAKS